MTPPTNPTVDESLDRLHRAGWSVGDAAFGPDHALVWLVTGKNGENIVKASGRRYGYDRLWGQESNDDT